ncbi:aldehyde dehydrogenase family protein, partial [Salmonella enterica]|uniref:aldehyde dehydrogenase family protein n=1 Tax=Salmonella enterica TaxID=28901 RepID=UPI000A606735
FVAAGAALKIGDPLGVENDLGPMARFYLRDEIHPQGQASGAEGARLLLGGGKNAREGNYYTPTGLADVTPDMTAFRQELFGPV